MSTPALRALRVRFPHVPLVGVLRSYLLPLFAGNTWLDGIISSDCFWKAAWQLRRWRAETCVLFPNSLRAALLAKLGGCRELVGYRRDGRSWLLRHALDWPVRENGRRSPYPTIWTYNRLVMQLGCNDPGVRMELFTTPDEEAEADAIWRRYGWSERDVVALHPGAAFGASKHWPIAYFVELSRRLTQSGFAVLALCGPNERSLAEKIELEVAHPAVRGLHRERLHLGLLKSCLRRVALLITTDSGPRHIAVAFDRPVITLFGPTHIAWTETFHPKSLHLQAIVPCGPCQLPQCPLDHSCMRALTPEFVFGQALAWLKRWRSEPCAGQVAIEQITNQQAA